MCHILYVTSVQKVYTSDKASQTSCETINTSTFMAPGASLPSSISPTVSNGPCQIFNDPSQIENELDLTIFPWLGLSLIYPLWFQAEQVDILPAVARGHYKNINFVNKVVK